VFLKKIANSSNVRCQIFWDCSNSPTFLQQEHLEKALSTSSSGNVLLQYIPVHKIQAISVAFCSGRIVAIASHPQGEKRPSLCQQTDDDVIWMHCPLSNEEKILEVWVVRHKNKNVNMGTRSLVVSGHHHQDQGPDAKLRNS
jgi:hypothetical protein